MRLLRLLDDGGFGLVEYIGGNDVPKYAILSHTWGADREEVNFKDLMEGIHTGRNKAGYRKLSFCGKQAAKDGLQFFWVDTCCIDKSSSSELFEAINSMFQWYRKAAKCYVYLSDVSVEDPFESDRIGSHQTSQPTWMLALKHSRWFTRGWTLQELLAPTCVEFFSAEGAPLGDRLSLLEEIQSITGIPSQALQGYPLSHFSFDERMSWAEKRNTKREEDKAYCLLGIFDIYMPLIYGEGKNAFRRLRKEIEQNSSGGPPKLFGKMSSQDSDTVGNLTTLAATQKRMQAQLADITEALDVFNMGVRRDKNEGVTVILGSAADASIAVAHIFRFLEDLYKAYTVHNTATIAGFSNGRWLQEQFNDMWADVQSAAATQIRSKKRRKSLSITEPINIRAQSKVRANIQATDLQRVIGRKFVSISRKRKAAVENAFIDVNLPIGNVRLFLVLHQQNGKMLGARLLYIPARHMQSNLKGVIAGCMRDQRSQMLARSLSTFQVHPEGSDALEHIRQGNLKAILDLLTTRRIYPNDRDEDGDSLLMIALLERQYEICKTLLQEGANPMDCDSTGKSVLCCFLDQIYGFSERFSAEVSTYLDSSVTEFALRLFIKYCGVDTGVTVKHFTDLGRSVGEYFIPVVHLAMSHFPDTATETFLFLPLRNLLNTRECDLEETDGFGRTALLASVECVKRSDFSKVANMLLRFGAVSSAVDNGDAGILHYILRTTSACSRAHTQQELARPIEALLRKFLLSGCNPNAVDENDQTPSDLALSPSTWVIWCNALQSVGFKPHKVLAEDDQVKDIVLDPIYLERKYQEALKSRPPRWTVQNNLPFQPGEDPPICAYCELPDDWVMARPPFDFLGSYLVGMEGYFAHAAFANHRDGTSCENARKWSLCRRPAHKVDGGISYWSQKSVSIRKHVACQLWENKILSEPYEAYLWATGLPVDWVTSVTN